MVDLVRRSTVERLARTIAVVPGREQRQLSSEPLSTVRDQELPGTLVLDRSHQPFDDRDAAVFADRSKTLADSAATAPPPEPLSAELFPLIGNQVPGTLSDCPYDSSQETPDSHRGGLLFEDSEPQPALR